MRNLYKETEYFLAYEAGVEWDDIQYINTKDGEISVAEFKKIVKEINYEPNPQEISIDYNLQICLSDTEFCIRSINHLTGVECWRYICTTKSPYKAEINNKDILLE